MKASVFCAALAGAWLFTAPASAQHPVQSAPGCCQGQPSTYQPYPATAGGFNGDCGPMCYNNQCLPDCDDCREPGRCKQWLDRCMAKIHACFSRHHQISSPVFKTHPFARSPRDYFMQD